MQTVEKDGLEIDLKDVFFIILERARLIVLAGFVVALVALFITMFAITPQYTSTTSLYVMNQQDGTQLTSSDMSVYTTLTADFEILVTSRTVLEQVAELVGLDTTAEELAEKISVNNPLGTRILEISVEDPDGYTAKQIADTLAVVSSEQIVSLMGMEQVNIVDYGNIADKPTSPSMVRNVAIGAAAGILLTILIVLVIYVLDDSIKTPEDVEQYLAVSVLGVIPIDNTDSAVSKKKGKKRRKLISGSSVKTPKKEND